MLIGMMVLAELRDARREPGEVMDQVVAALATVGVIVEVLEVGEVLSADEGLGAGRGAWGPPARPGRA